jgi:SAM-dependent methyltransferase
MTPVPFDRRQEYDDVLTKRGMNTSYSWFLCNSCGNATPSYQPDIDTLEEIWQTNRMEFGDEIANWAYRREIAKIGADRSWKIFSPLHSRHRRFLDIACGMGVTVKRFQDAGWSAEGNDIDANMKSHHNDLKINTRIGPIEKEQWEEPFDLIQIAYAIYFITNPKEYLIDLKRLLNPGGHIAIVMSDLLAYTQPGGASYVHTFLPTVDSMVSLLAHAGYRTVIKTKIRDSYFIAATPSEVEIPVVNVKAILRSHKTRAIRYKLFGANRARLKSIISKLIKK